VHGPLQFRAGTRIVAGWRCVEQRLASELHDLTRGTIAVIADQGIAQAGLLDPLLEHGGGAELRLCALAGIDPDVAFVERAAAAATEAGAQAVLGIGGGSALCAAKAVAIRLMNPGALDRYEGRDRLQRPPAPCIAVPTTAGSGTEVSTVVVLHDPERAQHLVIRGLGYEPDVALLDGSLLRTLPREPLVHAALDALSHALEALWSRRATRFTDALALRAADDLLTALPAAVDRDEGALQTLVEASAMANLACGNAEMGVVHALTSAPDVHLAHGYQNGVLLPWVADYNAPVLGRQAAERAAAVRDLYARIDFSPSFADGELSRHDAELMINAALVNPFLANNLRPAAAEDLRALLASAGAPIDGGIA
jgi:alcohol dehydrogenase class IV